MYDGNRFLLVHYEEFPLQEILISGFTLDRHAYCVLQYLALRNKLPEEIQHIQATACLSRSALNLLETKRFLNAI
jgi:hypothetical protein